MRYLTIVLGALLLTGCPVEPKPTPVPVDTNWCDDAEKTLERLQCKDRENNPMWVNKNGERFQHTCETAQREGLIFLNPQCVAKAEDCSAAKHCPAIE